MCTLINTTVQNQIIIIVIYFPFPNLLWQDSAFATSSWPSHYWPQFYSHTVRARIQLTLPGLTGWQQYQCDCDARRKEREWPCHTSSQHKVRAWMLCLSYHLSRFIQMRFRCHQANVVWMSVRRVECWTPNSRTWLCPISALMSIQNPSIDISGLTWMMIFLPIWM